ncbi:MAG: hypothetical protein J3R72DRAFT_435549 [Linnemannia gamsii]|nr:MAG: hypothetical protein J3R72DRAFT_435549 [Linnemannia gamsii]
MASRSASLLPLSGVMPKEELRRWLERTWYAWLDLSLYVPSTTLSLLRGVVNCPSLLTSLELIPQTRIDLSPLLRGTLSNQNSVYRRLHTYLCTSSKLVHLKHLRTAIILEDIDLFGRRWFVDSDIAVNEAQYPRNDESTTHMGIWLCRRLKSLRIEIHNGMESLRTSSVHSRIVFGYISRVCPYLESLEIDVPFADVTARPRDTSFYPQLSLKLEGGLCLLAKLDRLRRLRISSEHVRWTFDCEDYELNWISCSPYHRMNRMFRHWKMSRWKEMREHEKQQEESRLRFHADYTVATATKATKLEVVGLTDDAMNTVIGVATGADNQGYMAEAINRDPFNHLEGWFSAMGLENNDGQVGENIEDNGEQVREDTEVEEDEDIILHPPIDLEDVTMAPQTATASQDVPNHRIATSYVVLDTEADDNADEGTEDDEPFVPEPPPATCLMGVQQVVGDLQNLGLLHDVEVMIRWMQSDSFQPLPVLKRLSLGFETLQRPKDEMRRLFPSSIEP